MPTLNLSGETVEIKNGKNKKKQKLSHEDFIKECVRYLSANTEGFMVYYLKNDMSYSLSNLNTSDREIGIMQLKREILKDTIFDTLEEYFCEDGDIEFEDIDVEKANEFMQLVLDKLEDEMQKKDDE